MKLDNFVLYTYASVMTPVLVTILIGLAIVTITSYLNFKKDERNDLEDFIYRLPCKTESELLALKARYTSYLTDNYLKSSSKKWNNYIDAINKQLEQNNGNITN